MATLPKSLSTNELKLLAKPKPDLGRAFRRWLMREFVLMVPRRWRRRILPTYWPVEWRAMIGRADEQEIADMLNARRKERELRVTNRRLKKLTREYERLIINALTRVGVSHATRSDGHKRVATIRFHRPVKVSHEAIYFQVDTARLPWHTNITMLQDQATIDTVSAACRRRVRWLWPTPEDGFWLIVELKQGVRGIPREVDYAKMLTAIKPDAPRLTIPIGVGEAGRMYFRDIADMPHVLIGGATNQGKSVWMKQALVTLMLRNEPRWLKLIMIDLKGGVELSQFRNVPHLLRPIIKEKEGVIPALEYVMHEVKRRLAMFEERTVVDINGYNQRNRAKMDRWLVVIDELANLMLDKTLKGDAEILLADIAAQSRAAGIHLIVATQRPDSNVMTGLIRANFPVRIAFSCSDYRSSMVILDTSDAAGLNPAGRLIYFQGSTKTEMQGPLVTPAMVEDKVAGIATGEAVETLERSKKHNLTPHDLFRHALHKYNSTFPTRRIWDDLKAEGIARNEVEKIAQRFENHEIEIDGEVYVLLPQERNGALFVPRTLKRIEVQDDAEEIPSQPLPQESAPSLPNDEADDTAPNDVLPEESAPSAPDARELLETAQPTDFTEDEPDEFDEFAVRINQQFGIVEETADKA
jgi:hypothetical protein